MVLGVIEAGGTEFVCAIGDKDLNIFEKVSFPTTIPKETMNLVLDFFNHRKDGLEGIGVGSFDPIDIYCESKTYGLITSTPKLAWRDFDFIGSLKKQFNIPAAWTTDVNASCCGEYVSGNGRGLSNVVYYTVGAGIGGGTIQNGNFIEGFSHPEMGRMLVRRHNKDSFSGTCPFHRDCLESLAAGPAIERRSGKKGQEVTESGVTWEIEAYYIAQRTYGTTLMLPPDIIIFGSGVMEQEHLKKKVQDKFIELINGYVAIPGVNNYIMTPKLLGNSGTIGCLALARDVKEKS